MYISIYFPFFRSVNHISKSFTTYVHIYSSLFWVNGWAIPRARDSFIFICTILIEIKQQYEICTWTPISILDINKSKERCIYSMRERCPSDFRESIRPEQQKSRQWKIVSSPAKLWSQFAWKFLWQKFLTKNSNIYFSKNLEFQSKTIAT